MEMPYLASGAVEFSTSAGGKTMLITVAPLASCRIRQDVVDDKEWHQRKIYLMIKQHCARMISRGDTRRR